jgi:hypothetical protein
MSENNLATITSLTKQMTDEEEEDKGLRAKYGPAWNRLPSQNLNQAMKKQIEYYMQRYTMGKEADAKMTAMFEEKKAYITLLDLDKTEIAAKIPKSKAAMVQLSPAAMT